MPALQQAAGHWLLLILTTLKIKQRPYHLILVAALILVVLSFFVLDKSYTVDIQLYDTYFIIAHRHLFLFLAIMAFIMWIIYLASNRLLLSGLLTWAHVLVTVIALSAIALSLFYVDNILRDVPRRYYDTGTFNSLDTYNKLIATVSISIVILFFGQIVFVINFITGLIKRIN